MLITQNLWYALNHPPHANGLFKQITRFAPQPRSTRRLHITPRRLLITSAILLSLLVIIDILTPFSLTAFFIAFGIPGITLIVITAYGTVNGIQWVLRISGAIVRERTTGTYDLLCLLPHGEPGANWALCAAHLHRDGGLQTTHEKRGWMMPLAITMIMFSVFVIVGSDMAPADGGEERSGLILLMLTIANFAALTTILYIDYIQSLILASLIGILIPMFTRDHFDTQVASLGSFLVLQFTSYFMTILITFILIPQLFIVMHWSGWFTSFSLAILRGVIFFVLRDLTLQLLWYLIAQRLRIRPHELHEITRIVI